MSSSAEPGPPASRSAAANPFRWALIGEWLAKGSSAILLIALARWLTPSEVGIALLASAVALLGQALADAGLSRALVQETTARQEHFSAVFWINLGLAGLLCIAVVALAPLIASHFDNAQAATAIRVQSLAILISAASGVHMALLNRQLHFRPLAMIRTIGALTPVAFAVPMAIAGYGYWSLVCGGIGGAAAQTLAANRYVQWRPSLSMQFYGVLPLLRYGSWITLEVVLGWALLWLDALLVGGALGLAALGLYRTGSQIAVLSYALVLGPMAPVYFAKFAQLHGRGQPLGPLSAIANEGFWMAGVGLALALCFGAPVGVQVLMSTEWQAVTEVIIWVGLSLLLGWSVAANAEALRAKGQVRWSAALIALSIGVYATLLTWASRQGLETAAQARCLASLLLLPAHWAVAAWLLGVRFSDQLRPLIGPAVFGSLAFLVGSLTRSLAVYGSWAGPLADFVAMLAAVGTYATLVSRRARTWASHQSLARLPSDPPVPDPDAQRATSAGRSTDVGILGENRLDPSTSPRHSEPAGKPLLTVIIPTIGPIDRLRPCLEKLCTQLLPPPCWELLLIDNSAEAMGLEALADAYRPRLPVRALRCATPGLHAARHTGLVHASSDCLIYLDDDMCPEPLWLHSLATAFDDPAIRIATGPIRAAPGSPVPAKWKPLWRPIPGGGRCLPALSLLEAGEHPRELPAWYGFGGNLAIRKSLVIAGGGFRPDAFPPELIWRRGDGETGLLLALHERGQRTRYLPCAAVIHHFDEDRLTPTALTRRARKEGYSSAYSILRASDGMLSALLRGAGGLAVVLIGGWRLPSVRRRWLRAHWLGFAAYVWRYSRRSDLRRWVKRRDYLDDHE